MNKKIEKIPILFEDAHFVAVNKPASLPVHATLDPLRSHLQGILEAQLGKKLVLFHRLDLDTTGVVLFGQDSEVNKPITDMFREREMEKVYWAVVDGRWNPKWTDVKSFVRKSRGRYQNFKKGEASEAAETKFRLFKSNGERSFIEARPLTGRTHQIRLHCLEMHHAILGDRDYGKAHPRGVPMALHARSLKFRHPVSGERVEIEAPLPSYWDEIYLKGM